ncbi:MAG: TSUP family transporter [Alphaproteobacteria bacterium]|nr:TSUP family transporter [Alphaproteobacteria bacterium]
MIETAFLGVPGVNAWIFFGLSVAACCTSIVAMVTGTAGGLLLLAIMAFFFEPTTLLPLHTIIMLLTSVHVAILFWRYTLKATVLPFLGGSIAGAALGGQIFIALPAAILQGIIGIFIFILILTWLPKIASAGGETKRFAVVGFGVTFLGIFVSATGSLLASFVASASPDRRNHVATMGALMICSHVTKIVAFGVLGIALSAYVPLIIAMVAGAATGNWIGGQMLDRMQEQIFRTLFKVLLTILGLRLLWVGARGLGWF